MVTAEVSDSVEKTVAPIVNTSEVAAGETRFARGEETPQLKMNEDVEKEFTLSEEILEQVVARIGATVVEADGITLPTSPVEEVRPEEEKRASGEDAKEPRFYVQLIRNKTKLKRAVAVKREWDSATALAWEQATTLSTECAAVNATLQEREAQLREKKTKCEVLQLNLAKESGRCTELEETCGGLRKSNENAQKVTVDLIARLEKSREAYDEAVKRSERLITTAEKREKNYIEELARWNSNVRRSY
ncbi:hypothetical protein AXG93_3337s1070 [Marchantia polymorpha subsp. ruderalis]|uniref:Uncharacterized protein n=1 Tax=Marchantia polymorpha subsp. ruderalis TaxID=1480154 RepID=A0A176W5B4_MARPO|nr:hypothetical protein AXG93_3337s1070 [Marchantia polymorpha subsp. ruderalis]